MGVGEKIVEKKSLGIGPSLDQAMVESGRSDDTRMAWRRQKAVTERISETLSIIYLSDIREM